LWRSRNDLARRPGRRNSWTLSDFCCLPGGRLFSAKRSWIFRWTGRLLLRWHAKMCFRVKMCAGIKGDYPPPIRQLGFQNTYTMQSQRIPGILAALCRCTSARPHPGVDVLLQTKGEVQFERTVDSLSKLFFGLLSGPFLPVSQSLSALAGFQGSLCRLHPEALPDSS
jgi:hypothetical protein